MRIHKIAAIGGDGIGPEVVAAGLEVLETLSTTDGGFRGARRISSRTATTFPQAASRS